MAQGGCFEGSGEGGERFDNCVGFINFIVVNIIPICATELHGLQEM